MTVDAAGAQDMWWQVVPIDPAVSVSDGRNRQDLWTGRVVLRKPEGAQEPQALDVSVLAWVDLQTEHGEHQQASGGVLRSHPAAPSPTDSGSPAPAPAYATTNPGQTGPDKVSAPGAAPSPTSPGVPHWVTHWRRQQGLTAAYQDLVPKTPLSKRLQFALYCVDTVRITRLGKTASYKNSLISARATRLHPAPREARSALSSQQLMSTLQSVWLRKTTRLDQEFWAKASRHARRTTDRRTAFCFVETFRSPMSPGAFMCAMLRQGAAAQGEAGDLRELTAHYQWLSRLSLWRLGWPLDDPRLTTGFDPNPAKVPATLAALLRDRQDSWPRTAGTARDPLWPASLEIQLRLSSAMELLGCMVMADARAQVYHGDEDLLCTKHTHRHQVPASPPRPDGWEKHSLHKHSTAVDRTASSLKGCPPQLSGALGDDCESVAKTGFARFWHFLAFARRYLLSRTPPRADSLLWLLCQAAVFYYQPILTVGLMNTSSDRTGAASAYGNELETKQARDKLLVHSRRRKEYLDLGDTWLPEGVDAHVWVTFHPRALVRREASWDLERDSRPLAKRLPGLQPPHPLAVLIADGTDLSWLDQAPADPHEPHNLHWTEQVLMQRHGHDRVGGRSRRHRKHSGGGGGAVEETSLQAGWTAEHEGLSELDRAERHQERKLKHRHRLFADGYPEAVHGFTLPLQQKGHGPESNPLGEIVFRSGPLTLDPQTKDSASPAERAQMRVGVPLDALLKRTEPVDLLFMDESYTDNLAQLQAALDLEPPPRLPLPTTPEQIRHGWASLLAHPNADPRSLWARDVDQVQRPDLVPLHQAIALPISRDIVMWTWHAA